MTSNINANASLKFLNKIIILLMPLILNGCLANKQTGNLVKEEDIKKINNGMEKKEAKKILGAPNILPYNSPENWIYVFNKNSKKLNFTPKVLEHKVVTVKFDGDKVESINTSPYTANYHIKFDTSEQLYPVKKLGAGSEFIYNLKTSPISPKPKT
jgi:outer membrane protein assembly factor BamE (lipoprotein component of BamABCDE complex)